MTRGTFLKSVAALGVAGAAVGGGALWMGARQGNRYYQGPVREHFDGTRFHLPGAPEPGGMGDLLRWQMSGERARWPDRDPSPFRDRPPRRVEGRDLRVSYIGHASFLLQTGGVYLLFDPVWSERASPVGFAGPRRVNDPGVDFADLPPLDLVLVTHNHYDHLDLATLEALHGAHRPRFVVPLGNDAILRRRIPGAEIQALDWGEAAEPAPGLRIHLVPSVHWSARSWNDRRHALWGSFVLETPGGPLYLVGDTGFGDGETFREVGRRFPGIRLALLPIGAYEPRWFMQGQHVNPAEALKALEFCGARQALAHHWGTFQLTDEAIGQPVADLEAALAGAGEAPDRFLVLRPGQVFDPGRG
jgi:L-ascorbate metabolism protein UlaG (beta-lactamase superfamily)